MPPIGMPFLDDDDDEDEDLFVDKHVVASPTTDSMVKTELEDDEQCPVNKDERPAFGIDGVEELDVDPAVKQEPVEFEVVALGATADNDSLGLFVDRYEWDN